MCVVSMVMDHYTDRWTPVIPDNGPWVVPKPDESEYKKRMQELIEKIGKVVAPKEPAITDEEIKEFRKLLDRAREYDERNNEPECEMEQKVELLKAIAKALGVRNLYINDLEE